MHRHSGRICFVTATTERFVPGTLATLCSFRQHHPGFDGDFVVVQDGLPEPHRRHLAEACPGVRFEPISRQLRKRLAALRVVHPELARRPWLFYTLEAFRLRRYRKVLYYDSDVLFQAPVDDLFDSPATLVCCGDGAFARGRRRDAATFAPVLAGQTVGGPGGVATAKAPAPGAAGVLERTFNAGFLLIDEALVEADCYADLLALVTPETWRSAATTHTDQFLLNLHFAGRQTFVGWTYNFLLPMAEVIRQREGTDAGSAKALHFAGPVKPWMPEAMLHWAGGDPRRKPVTAFKRWYDAYAGHLADAHVRSAWQRRRGDSE